MVGTDRIWLSPIVPRLQEPNQQSFKVRNSYKIIYNNVDTGHLGKVSFGKWIGRTSQQHFNIRRKLLPPL
jgi:hypothetical protein